MSTTPLSPKSTPYDKVNVGFFIATPLFALLTTGLYLSFYTVNPWILVAAGIYYFLGTLSITGGYHRLYAHRTYQASFAVKMFYLLVGAGTFQQSVLVWASDHRRHHRFVDKERDPYNIQEGFWWAHIGWILHVTNDKSIHEAYPKDLASDPLVAWQHRWYMPVAIFMAFGLPLIVGGLLGNALGGLALMGLCRLVIIHHATFFINSLCHMWGRQPYTDENSARDSFVMALLTCGEGYHNYHHKFQSDYRNGIRWYHFDPTKWFVSLLHLFGLTRNLKTIPNHVIMKARMQHEQATLLERGISAERVQKLMAQLEQAQARFGALKLEYQTEYKNFKTNMQAQSQKKVIELRAELKLAKLEFKHAKSQWGAYFRALRSYPMVG